MFYRYPRKRLEGINEARCEDFLWALNKGLLDGGSWLS